MNTTIEQSSSSLACQQEPQGDRRVSEAAKHVYRVYRVKKQFDEADSDREVTPARKKHSRRSDRVRDEEFVNKVKEKIEGDPGKSMRAIAKMGVDHRTIVKAVLEDLGLESYALRKAQLLTKDMDNRKERAAAHLNNLKHEICGILRFFSDEKNFDQEEKLNPRNDRSVKTPQRFLS